MRLPRVKMTVRRLMIAVAVVALGLRVDDAVQIRTKARGYRLKAEYAERMERRCREIDAMDVTTRARAARYSFCDPYLNNLAWTRRMIPYFERQKKTYRYAAEHPREPLRRD